MHSLSLSILRVKSSAIYIYQLSLSILGSVVLRFPLFPICAVHQKGTVFLSSLLADTDARTGFSETNGRNE